MPDFRKISRANMRSLVDWFGCYDAVAETLNARWGGGASKGTVSKKVAGHLDWTVADVVALEDAAGRYPVTRMMTRRLEHRPVIASGSLLQDGSSIAKESGEAISAILAAEQSTCAAKTLKLRLLLWSSPLSQRIPVVVGVGQHVVRNVDLANPPSPLELSVAACKAALADCGGQCDQANRLTPVFTKIHKFPVFFIYRTDSMHRPDTC